LLRLQLDNLRGNRCGCGYLQDKKKKDKA
jgi:hypothetical protein